MKQFVLNLFFVSVVYSAFSQSDVSNHYKIYHSHEQREISLSQLASRLKEVDVIFFGEEHNDSIAHQLQYGVYRLLLEQYNGVTLSLEMFETDCQLVMDEYLTGKVTEKNLIKDGRAWNNYKDYRPAVELAKKQKQNVVAANAPRRYVSLVGRNGFQSLDSLSKDAKKYLPQLPISKGDTAYYNKFKKVMGNHGSSRLDKTYEAQTVWDATMANSICEVWKKNKKVKILHLNGRFHSDNKLGTVWQLNCLTRKAVIQNISCFPADDFAAPDWKKYLALGDFIIVTDPAVPKSFK
jgi:uncharacterized iron-regulated protein